jgi:hypothetical protein
MKRLLVRGLTVLALIAISSGAALGIAYWVIAQRFVAGDGHALDGIVRAPATDSVVFRDVSVWDGRGGPVRRQQSIVVRDGRIAEILDAAAQLPADVRSIDGLGKTVIPGLIDAHVHLMFDSGPDLLTRAPRLVGEWLAIAGRYPESRAPIVRRGQLKLKAGVTTMRVLGDGYYSLAYPRRRREMGRGGAAGADRWAPCEWPEWLCERGLRGTARQSCAGRSGR